MRVLITGARSQLATALLAQAQLSNAQTMSWDDIRQSASADMKGEHSAEHHAQKLTSDNLELVKYSEAEVSLFEQLFTDFSTLVPQTCKILPLTRQQLDISDPQAVSDCFALFKPNVVINCAAFNQVDSAENAPNAALAVNALGPENLAQACVLFRAKLIHFSSDYVFDGRTQTLDGYGVADVPNPLSVYGQSKLEGEKRIHRVMQNAFAEVSTELCLDNKHQPNGCSSLIIRTAWLYSCYGQNFVKAMTGLQQQRSQLHVIADYYGSPTWADALAVVVWRCLQQGVTGLYHYSAINTCSWFELACEIQKLHQSGASTEPKSCVQLLQAPRSETLPTQCQLQSITSKNYHVQFSAPNLPVAKRPQRSGLDVRCLHAALTDRSLTRPNKPSTGIMWSTWQRQLAEMIKQWHLRHPNL